MKTTSFPSLNSILKEGKSYFSYNGKMYTKNAKGEVVEFTPPSERVKKKALGGVSPARKK